MDQADAASLVRMGVGRGRSAVGGPAGVTDADGSGQGFGGQHGLQFADLALGAAALDAAVDDGRDPGGVIAAVLQPLQAVDQTGDDGACARNADDAAHEVCSGEGAKRSRFARGRRKG
ncbi:hypothetical protein D3C72_1566090 [compost metagenome]